jgi:hypothetical protein
MSFLSPALRSIAILSMSLMRSNVDSCAFRAAVSGGALATSATTWSAQR